MDGIDFADLFLMYLNGVAPPTDWQEVQEWAQGVCRVNVTATGGDSDGPSVARD